MTIAQHFFALLYKMSLSQTSCLTILVILLYSYRFDMELMSL